MTDLVEVLDGVPDGKGSVTTASSLPISSSPLTACGADWRTDLRIDWLADVAVTALIDEAELTPKPALVDRRGSGAHVDLDLTLMCRSAQSLRAGFAMMGYAAIDTHPGSMPSIALRERLGAIGRDAETTMLHATGGSNAHRGAIWIIGLLLAAAARHGHGRADAVAGTAAAIAGLPDRHAPPVLSHGMRVRARYGAAGARGEAIAGFPHVVSIGLPTLRRSRAAGEREAHARLNTLVAIIASLEDTCLLHRGGQEALLTAQRGARRVLAEGGVATIAGHAALLQLDADLLARNASPGGAADLLAATLFMDRIQPYGRRIAPTVQE